MLIDDQDLSPTSVPTDAAPRRARTALVLSGGGVAGIAWEIGVLRGIADADPALAGAVLGADIVIGTSAGASVAAQITSEVPLADLYAAQLRPETAEVEVDVDMESLFAALFGAAQGAADPQDAARRVGALALSADTVAQGVRMAAIDARLPSTSWPERDLRITAVDAGTGALSVLGPGSGVPLRDAVAASAAVPGVWPPVSIDGRPHIDGGVRSIANADLAAGAERVLVIHTVPVGAAVPGAALDDELAVLAGSAVHVVRADAAAVAAFGSNPLSPSTRADSARAGRALGAAQAATLARAWG
jgi:NTE family protein